MRKHPAPLKRPDGYAPLLAFILLFLLSYCQNQQSQARLPILGPRQIVTKMVQGQPVTDTLYARIPDFQFTNQDNQPVSNQTFAGKVYVSDFFFTSCPTICPKMRTQLLRVYDRFKDSSRVMLLSHTIDPQHDSVPVLQDYAQSMGVDTRKWHFVTGEKDNIYQVAQQYLVSAIKEAGQGQGFIHSGAFVLVDTQRRVRGIYDGTDPAQVDKLLQEIPLLLRETASSLPGGPAAAGSPATGRPSKKI